MRSVAGELGRIVKDSTGGELIGRWVVLPGRQIRKKNVTERLRRLPPRSG
jgi:hypothetical protein